MCFESRHGTTAEFHESRPSSEDADKPQQNNNDNNSNNDNKTTTTTTATMTTTTTTTTASTLKKQRSAERVAFLLTAVMATVVTRRVRNPACTAASALGKERHINGQQKAPLTLCMWRYINELHKQERKQMWKLTAPVSMSYMRAPRLHQSTAFPCPLCTTISGALVGSVCSRGDSTMNMVVMMIVVIVVVMMMTMMTMTIVVMTL